MKFPDSKGFMHKMDMDNTRLSLLLPRNLMIKWITLKSDIPIYHVYIHKTTSHKGDYSEMMGRGMFIQRKTVC